MLSKKLNALKNKLHGLTRAEIDRITLQVIKQNEDVVIELNRKQLLEGKNSKGLKVGSYRNKSYAKYKQQKNPQANGSVDLKLTGRFHDKFYLRTDSAILRVWSSDSKTDALVRKYGRSIFGLTAKSNKALAKVITPLVLERLIDRIRLR